MGSRYGGTLHWSYSTTRLYHSTYYKYWGIGNYGGKVLCCNIEKQKHSLIHLICTIPWWCIAEFTIVHSLVHSYDEKHSISSQMWALISYGLKTWWPEQVWWCSWLQQKANSLFFLSLNMLILQEVALTLRALLCTWCSVNCADLLRSKWNVLSPS